MQKDLVLITCKVDGIHIMFDISNSNKKIVNDNDENNE